MALSKQTRSLHKDSFNGLINNLLSFIPNEDKMRCRELVEEHKSKFRSIYEGAKPKKVDYDKKIKKIYSELKKSVVVSDIYANVSVRNLVETTSMKKCISSLKKLNDKLKNSNRLVHYSAGLILEEIKSKSKSEKKFESIIKRKNLEICKSLSYANKLIRFYNTCETYKNLKYATLAIRQILENLTDLTKLMIDDKAFWNNNIDQDPYIYDEDYNDKSRSIEHNSETDTVSDSILDSPESNSQSENISHTNITLEVDNLAIT